MSLSSGNYPHKLPIHKGGSTHDLNNFRPISLSSIFDKIIEKIIHARLYEFLEMHNLICKPIWFQKEYLPSLL